MESYHWPPITASASMKFRFLVCAVCPTSLEFSSGVHCTPHSETVAYDQCSRFSVITLKRKVTGSKDTS